MGNRHIWVLPPGRSDQNEVSTNGDRIGHVAQPEGVREGFLEERLLPGRTPKVKLSKKQTGIPYTAGSRAQELAMG